MKRLCSVCLVAWLGVAPMPGGPTESAIMAIMRLSDQPNYSWVATVSDDARTYDIQGKTTKAGFTHVKMPVINSVRRRLGRSTTDTDISMIFRGNVACVIETEDGWQRPDDLPPPDDGDADPPSIAPVHTPLGVGGSIPGGIMKGTVIRRQKQAGPREREDRAYSNLQLAISHPHEELGVIVGSHQEFKVEGDVITGTLSDLGAQLLLVRDGQKEITPLRAAGSFKLWLRDGMVSKYQVKLEGVLRIETPHGRREVEVHQTAHTVIKEIGTTTVAVPVQAQAKLGR